jgi:glycosyltransferase involved in cell wall biosynthesis
MDDVPAGPASPEPRRLGLAVVIPVYNGGSHLERCLLRLRESRLTEYDLIVVDDGSTDGSAALAESLGARVIRHPSPLGPAAARNAGALAATAPILFFIDSDVAVHPETLGHVLARFETDPDLAALFGSYDDQPVDPSLVSQFRNLLHCYVHQRGTFVAEARPAHTFWTGCGAIRRRWFLDLGGFDTRRYRRPTIEDIDFGYRLTRAGGRILLARDVQATHLKRWTLASMVRTDVFQRGVPWMLLIKRLKIVETDLNVRFGQKLSVAAVGLAVLTGVLSFWLPALLGVAAGACAVVLALNARFYRFLASRRGWIFTVAAFPLHFLYFGCCIASVLIAEPLWYWQRFFAAESDASPVPSPALGPIVPPHIRIDTPSGPAVPQARTVEPRRSSRWIRHRPGSRD